LILDPRYPTGYTINHFRLTFRTDMEGIEGESEYCEKFPVPDLASGITRYGDQIRVAA
jgi:hypothetical protein